MVAEIVLALVVSSPRWKLLRGCAERAIAYFSHTGGWTASGRIVRCTLWSTRDPYLSKTSVKSTNKFPNGRNHDTPERKWNQPLCQNIHIHGWAFVYILALNFWCSRLLCQKLKIMTQPTIAGIFGVLLLAVLVAISYAYKHSDTRYCSNVEFNKKNNSCTVYGWYIYNSSFTVQ